MVIIETPVFTKQVSSTLSGEEYRIFQATLLDRPDAGKIIPGGGGLREKFGLSQDKFANLVGISVGTLRNWEQGRRKPEGPGQSSLHFATSLLNQSRHHTRVKKANAPLNRRGVCFSCLFFVRYSSQIPHNDPYASPGSDLSACRPLVPGFLPRWNAVEPRGVRRCRRQSWNRHRF